MSTHDFESTVLTALADLKVEQAETRVEVKNIVSRLDRLNGTVGRHDIELREQAVRLASRCSVCQIILAPGRQPDQMSDDEIHQILGQK